MFTTTHTPWAIRQCYRLLRQLNPEYEHLGIVYLHKTESGWTWLINEYEMDADLAMGPVARFVNGQIGQLQVLAAENEHLRQQLADKEKTNDTPPKNSD